MSTFLNFSIADQTERETIAFSHQTNLSIEASAGTGKTTLLVQKYLSLIQDQHHSPSRIVVLTFTEKAALELKTRIIEQLKKIGHLSVLPELEFSPITTIHGFLFSCLKEMPFEAGLSPHFELLEPSLQTEVYDKFFKKWVVSQLKADSGPIFRALNYGFGLDRIKTLCFELYKNRFFKVKLGPPKHADVSAFFDQLKSAVFELYQNLNTQCVDTSDAGFVALTNLYKTFSNATALEQKEKALLFLISFPSTKGNQKNWLDPAHLKHLKETFALLQTQLDEFLATLRRNVFEQLIQSLLPFIDALNNEKNELKKVDFDDLLILTKKMLSKNSSTLTYFRKKFSVFLIDEFQDTDPLQAEILFELCKNEKNEFIPGKLCVVGDPKQSIYRFRGAHIETYERLTKDIERNGKKMTISQNFRSNQHVVEFVNALFSKTFENYSPLKTSFLPLLPASVFEIHTFLPTKNAYETKMNEAHRLAQAILEVKQTFTVMDPKTLQSRPLAFGDIALLFPTSTGLDILEEKLREFGIPFVVDSGGSFYSRLEIFGTLQCLKAFLNPGDAISVSAALKSIFFCCSDADIEFLLNEKKTLDYRFISPQNLTPHLKLVISHLKHFHTLIHKPADFVLEQFFSELKVFLTSHRRFHGKQAVANLSKLLDLARQKQHILFEFVDFLDRSTHHETSETEGLVSQDTLSHVRLMTIHKSKGLEFEVVFLCQLSQEASQTPLTIVDQNAQELHLGLGAKDERFATIQFERFLELEKEKDSLEKIRLLYVACTRAKNALFLSRTDEEKGRRTFQSLLNEQWDNIKPYVSIFDVPERISQKQIHDSNTLNVDLTIKNHSKFVTSFRDRSILFKSGGFSTPSDKKEKEFFSFKKNSGVKMGTVFHEIMARHPLKTDRPDEIFISHVCDKHHADEFKFEITELVRTTLQSDVWQKAKESKKVLREWPFVAILDQNTLEGVVDLMFLDQTGWTLVDYKTDAAHESIEVLLKNYTPQMKLYAEAFRAIHNFELKQSKLFFVRKNVCVDVL